mmetsp:Transcript_37833/g.66339  ORF Transcript_37833/g.66339 Transcript_37833/m.66339 type:complete len:448 (+) Transcript_37833:2-1345(+)
MEKAGPIYQFTHGIIQQTIYKLLPTDYCKQLHKIIGMQLLRQSDPADNASIHLIAVDQINIYCKGTHLSDEERSQFASINATAAKFSIAASRFEQARSYIDAGMQLLLLDTNRWVEQYSLTLCLYEMSASVSGFNGDVGALTVCLNEIIINVKSFEDSLTASSLLAKLLAASGKYDEAMRNCLSILSALGEEFPQDIDISIVLNELSVIQTTLANITVDQVKLLPPMTNTSKLHVMKFLSMLCIYSVISKPMLLPLLSCRMVRLTIEHGFCDNSIVGLVTAGWTLFAFTDEIEFGYRISRVGESLIEERPNKNMLLARSCGYIVWLKAFVEPVQSVLRHFSDHYNSGMLAGDVESAMLSRWAYCAASLDAGSSLAALSKHFMMCVQQSAKYQQKAVLHVAMAGFRTCMSLTGGSIGTEAVEIKSYDELNQIGKSTNNELSLLVRRIY